MNERVRLENEINELRYELSVTIPQEMQSAIELGDLRENCEFSDVVTRQYFASIRLRQLTERLNAYKAINLQEISKTTVGLGSIITVTHVEENTIMVFKLIMGEITDEVNTEYTEVTLKSPIGKALFGHQLSDEVTVSLPKGKAIYKIVNIKTLHDM
jgi:transcription elongation factor GreA